MISRLMAVLFLFAAFSCKKEEAAQPILSHAFRAYTGSVIATMNGRSWTGNVGCVHQKKTYSSLEDRFGVGIDRYAKIDGDSFRRESLDMTNIQYKVYKTDLEGFSYDTSRAFVSSNRRENAYYKQYFEDGDVVGAPCSILMSEPHWIEITSYDPATRMVAGKFALTILSYTKDTFRYENGSFNSLISL